MSSGRYVVVRTSWDHHVGPDAGWLQPLLEAPGPFWADVPAGTTVASHAEVGQCPGSPLADRATYVQWLALRFPTAKAAAEWVRQQCLKDLEWADEPDSYPRLNTLRETEEKLDDVSMLAYLGIP